LYSKTSITLAEKGGKKNFRIGIWRTVKESAQPKDSEGKIIGKKTVRVVFPV